MGIIVSSTASRTMKFLICAWSQSPWDTPPPPPPTTTSRTTRMMSSPSILDLVTLQLEPDMVMDTNTTIPAMGSMPTRDIMEDTMLVTTTEVTVMFLKDLSMVVGISLTTGTTTKNEKSLEVVKKTIL